jgi:hypothetical protein
MSNTSRHQANTDSSVGSDREGRDALSKSPANTREFLPCAVPYLLVSHEALRIYLILHLGCPLLGAHYLHSQMQNFQYPMEPMETLQQ